jgi:hypothetical protein
MSRAAPAWFFVNEGRTSMTQLVTDQSRWRVRRPLRGLMAVVVGVILIEIAVMAAHRVELRPRPGAAGELRGA